MLDMSEEQKPSTLQDLGLRPNSSPHVQELEEQVLLGRGRTRGGWSPGGRA